jgi:dCTP deaminase
VNPTPPSGVFSDRMILDAIDSGTIYSAESPIPPRNVQPASLDLRLGSEAFALRYSFLPHNHKVVERLVDAEVERLDITTGRVLHHGRAYLIPLAERLRLPENVRGRANPKSSTGRVDVFTRVITDNGERFDDISAGYDGPLYVEVIPQTFSVIVEAGMSLNQLRLLSGDDTELTDTEILEFHSENALLLKGQQPVEIADHLDDGMVLTVDLRPAEGQPLAYRARNDSPPVDLRNIGTHPFSKFWEAVPSEFGDALILEEDRFYILASLEQIRVPPTLCSEMLPFDPSSGEIRSHYAGFFDPGFGYAQDGSAWGTKGVLEVRARDVSFMLEHGQRVCKMRFDRMAATPQKLYGAGIGSSYHEQGLTLGKYFSMAVEPARQLGLLR